jgi:hypothetical protein
MVLIDAAQRLPLLSCTTKQPSVEDIVAAFAALSKSLATCQVAQAHQTRRIAAQVAKQPELLAPIKQRDRQLRAASFIFSLVGAFFALCTSRAAIVEAESTLAAAVRGALLRT